MITDDPVLLAACQLRTADTDYLPRTPGDADGDRRIATFAATIALRRHARGEVVEAGVRRGGVDLRDVKLVVGSGGVLRHSPPGLALAVLTVALRDTAGGWALPRDPRIVIDSQYVLAAAGLLAEDHPDAAMGLLSSHL
jgi:hypothetical protein